LGSLTSNSDTNDTSSCEVPESTIADIDYLIKRTLNLGVNKESTNTSTDVNRIQANSSAVAKKESRLPHEWDESIVNVEVLFGLREPRNSTEALAVVAFNAFEVV